jgi:arylsulfatase A-like enzyme
MLQEFSRKKFIQMLLLGSGVFVLLSLNSCNQLDTKNDKKPNILFIVCDDLNDAVEGMGGHPQTITPNINRLASKGVLFTNAHSNAPLCAPSRASLLTGLYPHTTGYYSDKNNWKHFRESPVLQDAVTFMEHFWKSGYDVLGTGKIFHNFQEENEPWPWDGKNPAGFNGPLHPSLPKTMRGDNMFSSLAKVPNVAADPINQTPGHNGWRSHGKNFYYLNEDNRDLMADELNANWACEKLTDTRDNSFLMCVGFNRPHTPLIVPQKYFDLYPLDKLELAVKKENDLDDCAKILRSDPKICNGTWGFDNYIGVMKGGGEELLKRWTQAYLASVSFVDDQLGRILDTLEESAYAQNTYIIFTSDHGYHMGEKNTLYKLTLWEESGRIPLIIAGPGIPQGEICDQPVSLIDLYPTMINLCNIEVNPNKNGNGYKLDGFSVVPLLKEPEKARWDGPDVALTVVANDKKDITADEIIPARHHYAVRSKRYRYILCNNGEEELYDHEIDSYEWKNLADDQKYYEIKMELKKQLLMMTEQM